MRICIILWTLLFIPDEWTRTVDWQYVCQMFCTLSVHMNISLWYWLRALVVFLVSCLEYHFWGFEASVRITSEYSKRVPVAAFEQLQDGEAVTVFFRWFAKVIVVVFFCDKPVFLDISGARPFARHLHTFRSNSRSYLTSWLRWNL